MSVAINKNSRKIREKERSVDHKFDSVEEAAQEKTDHVWNTVFKNVNWDKFEELRKKQ